MNKVIENYVLKEKLGSGQYGDVFKAEDQNTGQVVAVKVMNVKKFRTTPKLSEFTSNEIAILTKVENPHIIHFIEMLRTANNYYLVYEYCNGGTLQQLLKKRRFLPEAEALKIFAQILDAFKVLFKEKILHRDLKPSNILFHDGVLKLADFGFCKELIDDNSMAQTMVGSPIYMAPEVLKNEIYNSKADIWSMGVVLYEILYGVCPFEEKTITKLVNLIDHRPLQLPLEKNPISESTQQLLKAMLCVDPKKRIGPNEILNFKLFPEEPSVKKPNEAIGKKPESSEEACRFNRQNLEYMIEAMYACAAEVDSSRERLILTYLLSKLISHYQNNLKKKSKYWQAAKVTGLPEPWDRTIDEELAKLDSAGSLLKEACSKIGNPGSKLKSELDSPAVSIAYFLECLEALKNSDLVKLQLTNCLLIHSQMLAAMQRGEVSYERLAVSSQQKNLDQTLQRKLERCRELAQLKSA